MMISHSDMAQPIPKPKTKKKRARNNPRLAADRICAVCGRPYAERHEIFFGTGQRQLSIKYGLQIDLCYEHHRGMTGPHRNRAVDLKYKRAAQAKFEESHSREEFRRLFVKSYL